MSTASEFLLDDAVYENVRDGWNQKLNSSSLKLSGLVPFVELYAVFRTNDVIFSNPTMFSEVANRAVDVKFQYTRAGSQDTAMEFQKRFDIPTQAKIVPVASTAQAQTEEDTIYGSSYRGAAGINDLSVTRGASGPMNIKYSLNMQMPNPEVINDMYEYSKLMILNSSFLLVYGWNPFGFEAHVKTMPPRLVQEPTSAYGGPNIVELNASNGGFYKSSLVNLNRFNFSLDNVGHLGGKLDFLTLAGNFLVTTRANAIGAQCKKMLNGYSGMLFTAGSVTDETTAGQGMSAQETADRWISLGEDWLEESLAYKDAWQRDMERRLAAGKKHGFGSNIGSKREFQITGEGLPKLDSPDQWYATTTRASGRQGDSYEMHDDNGHFGRLLGTEMKVDPYGDSGAQYGSYYGGNKDEITRFRKFTGEGAGGIPFFLYGQTVPDKYTREADPLLFTQIGDADSVEGDAYKYLWQPKMKEWNELGMGHWGPGFRAAKYPKRIKNPQDVPSYADILKFSDPTKYTIEPGSRTERLRAQYDAYRNVWETGPDHEELAASYNYISDLRTELDGTVVQGWKPGSEATENDKVEYEKTWQVWIDEVISDLTLAAGRHGTIFGAPGGTQYSNQNLKPIPYLEWLIAYYKKERKDVLGFMNIDSEKGIPWAQPDQLPDEAFEQYGKNREDITTLDTMPSYGRDLMHNIWDEFMEPDNPNRHTFFPVDPDAPSSPSTRNQLGKKYAPPTSGGASAPTQFLDEETVKIMSDSCAISTMLVDVAPPEEESEKDDDRFWGLYFDRFLSVFGETEEEKRQRLIDEADQLAQLNRGEINPGEVAIDEDMNEVLLGLSRFEHTIGGGENPNDDPTIAGRTLDFITHSKPVYYFLGAVLESFRRAMNDKIKFMYDDIPLEGAISPGGFPFPIPKVNSEFIKGAQKEVDELRKKREEWVNGYIEIDNRHPKAVKFYQDGGDKDFPNFGGTETKKRKDDLEAAGYRYPYEDEVHWDEDDVKDSYMHDGVEWHPAIVLPWKEGKDDSPIIKWDLWGKAISTNEFERQSEALGIAIEDKVAMANVMAENSKEILNTIMCKNVFELPVEISVVRKILSEGNAPLHNVINKLLKACDATTKTVRLSTRPYAADETYLEIFVANLRVDGATTQVFEDLDIHSFLMSNQIRDQVMATGITNEQINIARALGPKGTNTAAELAAARHGIMGAYFSEKAVVCEFGTERSLVESFNLSSKVDPLAFASFRLPDVIGGQSIDIAEVVRGRIDTESMGLMNDIRGILEKGMFSGKEQLRDLNIIGAATVGSSREVVNTRALKAFLLADQPAATKIQTTFLTNLMAANQELNTKIIALQNEAITSSGDPNNPQNNSFYGGVLSTYLRSISLTIHGVVGLSMFNVVYIKGLMRGIEGLYLITTVNESITPASFSTSLECKLIQYKDKNPLTNPLAGDLNITLEEAAADAKGTGRTDFDVLFAQTEERLKTPEGGVEVE